jgi:O-antigen/teichoic acid export membrane protein
LRIKLTPSLVQALCYAIGLFMTKGISLIILPIVTHYLTPAEFGTLEVLVTFANGGSIILALGLTDVLFRFAGEKKDPDEQKNVAANIFGLALGSGLLYLIPGQLAAPQLAHWLPGEVTETQLRMMIVSLCFTTTILIPLAWLRMRNRAINFLMVSVGKAGAQAALVVWLLQQGYGVTGYVAAALITDMAMIAYLVVAQWRDTGIRLDLKPCRDYLVYGSAIVVSASAAFLLGHFDRWVLADVIGTAKMAEYALAAKFGLITMLLMEPFEMWWYPRRFAQLDTEEGRAYTARFTALGVALVTTVAVGVSLMGPVLLELMVPSSYFGAVAFIPWLAAITAMQTTGNLVNVGCYAQRTGTTAMYINLVGATLAMVGYFTLVPSHGILGAVMARGGGQITRIVLFMLIGQRLVYLPFPTLRLLVYIAASCGMVVLGQHATTSLELVGFCGISLAVSLGLLVTLRLTPLKLHHLFERSQAKQA